MRLDLRRVKLPVLVLFALMCAGCGGGGGSGGGNQTLGLGVDPPDLTGQQGQDIALPVTVNGGGTAYTADFELYFADGVFEPAGGGGVQGQSAPVQGLPNGTACRYRWLDSRTIRVLYASAGGTGSGNVLVSVPVRVKAEGDSGLVVRNAQLNQ